MAYMRAREGNALFEFETAPDISPRALLHLGGRPPCDVPIVLPVVPELVHRGTRARFFRRPADMTWALHIAREGEGPMPDLAVSLDISDRELSYPDRRTLTVNVTPELERLYARVAMAASTITVHQAPPKNDKPKPAAIMRQRKRAIDLGDDE